MRIKRWIPIILLLSLVFTFAFSNVANAEEEKQPVPTYKQIEEKFDCDMVDMICKVNLWIIDISMEIFDSVIGFVKKSVEATNSVIKNPTIQTWSGYFKGTAKVLISSFFMFHLVKILAYYWVEEDVQRFKALINKLLVTVTMLMGYEWSFDKLITVTTKTINNLNPDMGQFQVMFIALLSPGASLVILMFLVIAVFMLIIFFQVLIRSGELAFMYITGPFCIATNMNDEFNLFTPWWRSFISLLMTQFVQVLLLVIFVELLSKGAFSKLGIANYMLSISFMFLIVKSPAFLKELMYSTGTGQAAVGATTKSAGAIGKQLIRRMTVKQ